MEEKQTTTGEKRKYAAETNALAAWQWFKFAERALISMLCGISYWN